MNVRLFPLIAVVAACCGADAALAPRTLVYHFQVSARGFQSDSHINVGGSAGKITVVETAGAQDGTLGLDLSESVEREPRAMRTVHCTLKAASSPNCDWLFDADRTSEQESLLDFLRPGFYDPAHPDSHGRWHTRLVKTDGSAVTLAVDSAVSQTTTQGSWQTSSSGTVLYDVAAGQPNAIHLEVTQVTSDEQGDETIDLNLLSDSAAKTGSRNPH